MDEQQIGDGTIDFGKVMLYVSVATAFVALVKAIDEVDRHVRN